MKVLCIASLLLFCVVPAQALVYTVTRTDDRILGECNSGVDCTLREAITLAASTAASDNIIFASDVRIITLTNHIAYNGTGASGGLTIFGTTGANRLTITNSSNFQRIFTFESGSIAVIGVTLNGGRGNGGSISGSGGAIAAIGTNLTIDGVLFTGNSASGTGGAIFSTLSAAVTIRNSTFSGNSSGGGGAIGIENQSTVTISNSTFTGNVGTFSGGALRAVTNTTYILRNTTISYNTSGSGGGIECGGASVNIGNSIIAGNFGTNPDINGVVTTAGNNLVGNGTGASGITNGMNGDAVGTAGSPINARLGGLQHNGGAIPTMALQAGSPAINTGSDALASGLSFDQRGSGFPRLVGTVDRGAYEYSASFVTHRTIDFDGDAKTDLSIFRPSNGQWWYNRSSDGGNFAATFGLSSDTLVPGDFSGDNKTDIAFWRPSTGEWFVLRSENQTFFSFPFGTSTDLTAPGDYDGDGRSDAAVYRRSNTTWYIRRSSDGGSTIQSFGAAEDFPVAADYDGDGRSDIAIYRPSLGQWWWQRSSDGVVQAVTFGTGTDRPVQGDYTGDGKADIAFWRPGTRQWFVLRSDDFSFFSAQFGIAADIPTPGDYDGDGKFDLAIFRSSNSTWFVTKTTGGTLIMTFGTTGDRAVPNAFVPIIK